MTRIAIRFGTTWQELQRINGIPNADLIYAGQRLRLPSSASKIASVNRKRYGKGSPMSANLNLNRHGVEMPGMARTFHGNERVSVEMSIEQHATIYAALAVASTDSVLPLEVRHEYAALARLFGEAPIVGLTD